MWMKLCGLVCIFVSCVLSGLEMEHRLKQRWMFLWEMKETLHLLEKDMTWHRTPLPEALFSAAQVCKTPLGPMLLCCAGQIEARSGRSFGEIWRECARGEIPAGLLSEVQMQSVLDTGKALCNTDTELQKTHLKKQEQHFENLCAAAQEEWREKGMLYRRLSAAAGAAAVILLL
ncbi:MAG: stage III sporulation protein AB [Lachnospiraceae bacterium]|nr:stage III sporulation protein AB [Lachnospiraceae bacterium]